MSALAAVVAAALSGCVTNAGWRYEPNPAQPAKVSSPLVLAVFKFADAREQDNTSNFFLCLLPAVPYCTATYHRPDTADDFHTAASYNFRPSEDLAKAAAQEIRQAGLFREVYITDRSLPADAQLVLRGTILKTDWNGTRTTYGLAGDGQLLWLLGLPVGSAESVLEVKLELVEQVSGKVLWSYDVHGSSTTTEGLYYNFGSDFGYPALFRDGMKEARASLEQYVASQPADFWERMRAPEQVVDKSQPAPALPSASPSRGSELRLGTGLSPPQKSGGED